MNKDVIVSIKGKQINLDKEEDIIELITEGKFYSKEGKYYIVYKESEISGMEGTTTTIKIEDDMVSLIRLGTNNSHLVFRKGTKYVNYYNTPYGDLHMEVFPTKVESYISDTEGSIDLRYHLDVGGSYAGENQIFVSFKEGKASDRKHDKASKNTDN
ncbi:MAG: DUF1934 domain-containing protein [Clostridia bacterium]|nr:DUF1934 domain-containing protein [Clostridia bacterium]